MATRMQQRRATAAQWTSVNPVLAAGEIGFETDTNKFKIGNSVNTWDTLEYFTAGAEVDLTGYATESYVDSENVSQTATITAAYEAYADGATTDMATTTYVDDQDVATLAAANAYTDTEIAALVDSSPATLDTLNELAAALGDDANFATTVSNQIASKADASHTHAISDVTNLQTEIDGKLSSSANYTTEATYGPFQFGAFTTQPTETTLGVLNTYGGFVPSGSISIGDEFRVITSWYRNVEIDNVVFIYQGTDVTGAHTCYLKDNADQQAVTDYNNSAQAGDSAEFIVTTSDTANITEQNLASLRNVTSDIQGQIDAKSRVLLAEETIQNDNRFQFSLISQDYDELIFEGVDLSLYEWDQFRLRINSINADVNFLNGLTDVLVGNTSSSTSNVFELRIPNYSLTDRPKMGTYSYAGYNPAMGYASGQGVIFDATFNAITQFEFRTGDENFSKGTIRMYGIKY